MIVLRLRSGEPFGATDRAAFKQDTASHVLPHRDSKVIVSRVSFVWGSQKVDIAGSAAPALNATLTEVPESLAGLGGCIGCRSCDFSACVMRRNQPKYLWV